MDEWVVGCSLHSSGHVFSPASSDESENSSHVPLIRLFRPTQAWPGSIACGLTPIQAQSSKCIPE